MLSMAGSDIERSRRKTIIDCSTEGDEAGRTSIRGVDLMETMAGCECAETGEVDRYLARSLMRRFCFFLETCARPEMTILRCRVSDPSGIVSIGTATRASELNLNEWIGASRSCGELPTESAGEAVVEVFFLIVHSLLGERERV